MVKLFILVVSCIIILHTHTAESHRFGAIVGCDKSGTDFSLDYNEEKIGYFDYTQQKVIDTLPDFIGPLDISYLQENAKRLNNFCTRMLAVLNEVYENFTEQMEPPWTSIYPKSEVKLKQTNSLVCHISAFFPPPVTVTWTKNVVDVSDEAQRSPYYTNSDGTLSVFSVLNFTPEEGDSYSCTVQHPALDIPQTRIWDVKVDVTVEKISMVPSVVCGVGLALGLLGVTVGVFFFVKASDC